MWSIVKDTGYINFANKNEIKICLNLQEMQVLERGNNKEILVFVPVGREQSK